MSARAEARSLFFEIAGPMPAGSKVKEMLSAVETETRLGIRRLRGIWNNEARIISSEEMDALRAAAKRKAREAEDRDDFRALRERVARLERRLAEVDPQLPGASAEEHGALAVGSSRSDRSVAGA